MLLIDHLSNDDLTRLEKQYRAQALELIGKANDCTRERVRRDSVVMLREAELAQERARTGVCTDGIGDCPVHQMGSCKVFSI